MIITTARKPDVRTSAVAREIGKNYGLPFVCRGNLSLETLIAQHDKVLLLSREQLSCYTRAGQFFLHPNMAAIRIKQLRQGGEDRMLAVMDLWPGESLLDCTAGLCADSLVAKYRVGTQGRVVALEKSLPIYIVVRHGLENYTGPERFRELAAGIELAHADYRDYLANLPPRCFDLVYFDPMFIVPVLETSSLEPLRPIACHLPLTVADIEAAARVARKRVVVKERSFFDFMSLGLEKIHSQSKISYGVLEVKGAF